MNRAILGREFYAQNTVDVARNLLGKILSVRSCSSTMQGRIVETEAYLTDDAACHAYRGKTPRNAVMFGAPGHTYVYFSYGCHYMLNLVTAHEDMGEAVLIRALEPISGIETMRQNRGSDSRMPDSKLCAGPGRLAKALGITRELHNGIDVCSQNSLITVLDSDPVELSEIDATPRIGISHATEHLWRFVVGNSPSVSRR